MDAETANRQLLDRLTAKPREPRAYLARHSAKALAKELCSRKALRGETTSEWLPRVTCPDCSRPMPRVAFIAGNYSEARDCDSRCTSAVGPACDCHCAGKNHGRDHG
jgi:hypothetical protein